MEQGIPTLVMAASSFDDVIAISLFGVFLGIAFSEGLLYTHTLDFIYTVSVAKGINSLLLPPMVQVCQGGTPHISHGGMYCCVGNKMYGFQLV